MKHNINLTSISYDETQGLYTADFSSNIVGIFTCDIDAKDAMTLAGTARIEGSTESEGITTTTFLPPIVRVRVSKQEQSEVIRKSISKPKQKKETIIDDGNAAIE